MSAFRTSASASPQQLLDALHQVNLPRVYDPALSAHQRQNLLALVKTELHDWRAALRDQMHAVRRRYSPQEAAEAKLALAPFRLLDDLGKELARDLHTVEQANQAGRPIPEVVTFGRLIFGTPDLADWHLGGPQDAGRYDDMMAIRRRLENLLEERAPVEAELRQLTDRIKAQQARIQDDIDQYKRRTNVVRIIARTLFVGIIVVGLALGTYFFSTAEAQLLDFLPNAAARTILILVSVIFIAALILDRRRRVQAAAQHRADVAMGKRRLAQLKQRHKAVRLHYYPLNELVQQLQHDYDTLRATF